MHQTPSSTILVLRKNGPLDIDELLRDLRAEFGAETELEVVAARYGTLLVRLPRGAGDPKDSWRRVRDLVGPAHIVAPVLVYQDGEQWPTGTLTVRFSSAPGNEELERFAAAHNLDVDSRNKFVESQVSFRPRNPERCYLPDLMDEARKDPSVVDAWADTESKYRRI